MMKEVVDAMYTIAERLNLVAPTIHQTIFNVIDFYFWRKSSKYFPATAYNQDTQLAYIDVWFSDPDRVYNNVPPLTQIHGDHYETEREWVAKRIVYMFSKYQIGAFEAGNADGMGSLEFTPAEAFTMNVTPAIDLYPRVSYGGSVTENSQRTKAGDVCQLPLSASGTTGNYIKSMDWLSDLGDLTDLKLSPRSAADAAISFSVKGKRLRRLKVGDASKSSSDIKFNAATLGVESEALEVLDARNVATVEGSVSLQKCPRIREAYLSGTAVKSVIPPKGGRLLVLDLPDTVQDLILNELNLLEEEGLQMTETALGNIRNLYINSCNNINPVDLLHRIFNKADNQLTAIGIIWKGWLVDTDGSILKMFGDIAKKAGEDGGYTGVDFTEDIIPTSLPNISGALDASGLNGVYQEDIDAILLKLPNLLLKYDPSKLYMSFADPEVLRVLLANMTTDDNVGITEAQAASVTSIGTWFRGNTTIQYFNEFEKFTGVNKLGGYAFTKCTLLKSLIIPSTITTIESSSSYLDGTFNNCTSLIGVGSIENIESIGNFVFYGCTSLSEISFSKNNLKLIGNSAFYNCTSLALKELNVPNLTSLGQNAFYGVKIKKISDLGQITALPTASNSTQNFGDKSVLEEVVLPDTVTIIPNGSFYKYTKCVIEDLNLPNLTSLDGGAFNGTKLRKITSLGEVTRLPNNANSTGGVFQDCIELTQIQQSVLDKLEYVAQAFQGCVNLEIEELRLPNLTEISAGFANCNKIRRVMDLGKITRFFGDTELSPNSNPFGTNVQLIILPESVESIGRQAFRNSGNSLQTVILKSTTPPSCALYWDNAMPSTLIFYVPDASAEAYKTATNWSNYADRIKGISELSTDNPTLYEEVKEYL
jgi:hypothetical protein